MPQTHTDQHTGRSGGKRLVLGIAGAAALTPRPCPVSGSGSLRLLVYQTRPPLEWMPPFMLRICVRLLKSTMSEFVYSLLRTSALCSTVGVWALVSACV